MVYSTAPQPPPLPYHHTAITSVHHHISQSYCTSAPIYTFYLFWLLTLESSLIKCFIYFYIVFFENAMFFESTNDTFKIEEGHQKEPTLNMGDELDSIVSWPHLTFIDPIWHNPG